MGVLHQPHNKNKKIKRVTRLVILPDYQGIGLGTKFLNFIAEYYKNKNFDFSIVTSAKNLATSLIKNDNWCLIRYSANKRPTTGKIDFKRNSLRTNCKTYSFFYKGIDNEDKN